MPCIGLGAPGPGGPGHGSVVVTISPGDITPAASQIVPFTVSIVGLTDQSVHWTLDPPTAPGTIDLNTGRYVAPATVSSSQTLAVIATSVADPTKSGVAYIHLILPVTVSVSPPVTSLSISAKAPLQAQQFTPIVDNTPNQTVTWKLDSPVGFIDSTTGLYTAPAAINSQQTVTAIATSVADPSKQGTATIRLTPVVVVTIPPPSITVLHPSDTLAFTAGVSGTTNPAVMWYSNPEGLIDPNSGVFTAPSTISSSIPVAVIAASVADPTKRGTVTVTLKPSPTAVPTHEVDLTWIASTSDLGTPLSGYIIYRYDVACGSSPAPSGPPPTPVSGPTLIRGTSFADTEVEANQCYFYDATFKNDSGTESAHSASVGVHIPSP